MRKIAASFGSEDLFYEAEVFSSESMVTWRNVF